MIKCIPYKSVFFAVAIILLGSEVVLINAMMEMSESDAKDLAPAYDTIGEAASGFVEEESIWKNTAWIETTNGETLLLSERRDHVFLAGHVTEAEEQFQNQIVSASVSFRDSEGGFLEGEGRFEVVDDDIVQQPYEFVISSDENFEFPNSEFGFDLVEADEERSVVKSVEFLKGLKQDEEQP